MTLLQRSTIISAVALGFVIAVSSISVLLGLGCSATPAQIAQTFTDGWKLTDCILAKVLVGIVDPVSLLGCAGATEQLVIDILNDFKAKRAASAGLAAPSPTYVQQGQWIDQAIQNMTSSLAAKKASK